MEPRLTRGEYWLLETAVSTYYPMSYLCSERYFEPSRIEQVFNKPGHGLDRDQLIATLRALFRDGLIEAVRDDFTFQMDESQIRDALDEKRPLENPSCTRYRMTPRGAAAWEVFAAPQWERFILDESLSTLDDRDLRPGTVICMSEWRLQRYLANVGLAGFEIEPGSVEIKKCGKWNPTYWKELPDGFQAQFQWRMGERPPQNQLHWFAFAGFCDLRDGWYRWR